MAVPELVEGPPDPAPEPLLWSLSPQWRPLSLSQGRPGRMVSLSNHRPGISRRRSLSPSKGRPTPPLSPKGGP